MSYAAGAALQAAVFTRLSTDAALVALVGAAIHDAMPPGPVSGTYVSLGPETVRDAADGSGPGAWHEFTVSVLSDAAGFQRVKEVAAAVSDALLAGPDLALTRGHLVGLWFLRARARRIETGGLRRLDLTFRARVAA